MTQERRKTNRLPIDVTISLKSVADASKETGSFSNLEVDVVNISRGGIAFCSDKKLELNSFFDTTITLWTKEKIDTVIEIVRREENGDGKMLYGCLFIGLQSSEQLKIQIYEMVSELEKNGHV